MDLVCTILVYMIKSLGMEDIITQKNMPWYPDLSLSKEIPLSLYPIGDKFIMRIEAAMLVYN